MSLDYRDVLNDPVALRELLQYSRGKRLVPVIVDGGRVQIGFEGRS